MKANFIPKEWNEKYTYMDYSFSEEGIRFAQKVADGIKVKRIEPIFIDEIGPLEIYHELGLYNIFRRFLENKSDMFISVRDKCLGQLIRKFDLKEYKITTL